MLDRALRSGDVPTLRRWLVEGRYELVGWETGWSSQTGVSQCGILHGSVVDMPAFRWVDKATGTIVVSNRPASAAAIEARHSDGQGLLAHDGSSYGNLFSGDAERAVLTMSNVAKKKEGRVGAGYVGVLLAPTAGGADPHRGRRRDRAGARSAARTNAVAASSPVSTADGPTPCCARSRPWSAATCASPAC